MSTQLCCTEGVILQVIPYRDYDQIVTLFTADHGLLKLMCKKKGTQGFCHPLTRVEVIFKEKNSEIFRCEELSLLNSYLDLRKQLSHLNAACDLIQALYASQFVGKNAPALYQLLIFYLEKITQAADPFTLAASFRLKLLRHEGLLSFPLTCFRCHENLTIQAFISHSQLFCSIHSPQQSLCLSEQELQLFHHLTLCGTYRELALVHLPPGFKEKIDLFFREQVTYQ